MNRQAGFEQHVRRMATNLRRIADNIEHELEHQEVISDTAQAIAEHITNGFANLGIALLLRWTVRVIEGRDND